MHALNRQFYALFLWLIYGPKFMGNFYFRLIFFYCIAGHVRTWSQKKNNLDYVCYYIFNLFRMNQFKKETCRGENNIVYSRQFWAWVCYAINENEIKWFDKSFQPFFICFFVDLFLFDGPTKLVDKRVSVFPSMLTETKKGYKMEQFIWRKTHWNSCFKWNAKSSFSKNFIHNHNRNNCFDIVQCMFFFLAQNKLFCKFDNVECLNNLNLAMLSWAH